MCELGEDLVSLPVKRGSVVRDFYSYVVSPEQGSEPIKFRSSGIDGPYPRLSLESSSNMSFATSGKNQPGGLGGFRQGFQAVMSNPLDARVQHGAAKRVG